MVALLGTRLKTSPKLSFLNSLFKSHGEDPLYDLLYKESRFDETSKRRRRHLESKLTTHGFKKIGSITPAKNGGHQKPLSEVWMKGTGNGVLSLYISDFTSATRNEIKEALPGIERTHNGKAGVYFGNGETTYITFNPLES